MVHVLDWLGESASDSLEREHPGQQLLEELLRPVSGAVDGAKPDGQDVPRLVEGGDAGLVLDAVQDVVLVNRLVSSQLQRPDNLGVKILTEVLLSYKPRYGFIRKEVFPHEICHLWIHLLSDDFELYTLLLKLIVGIRDN